MHKIIVMGHLQVVNFAEAIHQFSGTQDGVRVSRSFQESIDNKVRSEMGEA